MIPDYQTLMLPLLRLAAEGETRVPDASDRLAEEFGLTPAERDQLLASGRQRLLHNRVHWAKFYMSKAGLLASPRRGVFTITDAGRKMLAETPDRIDVTRLLAIPSFAEFYKREASERPASPASPSLGSPDAVRTTPEEQIEAAYAAIHATLRDELIQRILQNSPSFFEGVIVDLLVGMGYGGSRRDAALKLGRSGDGGVDGVISEDRLGLDRVYVQAKRYGAGSVVGRPDVQGFVGSLVGLGASKGVFVTTSTFTAQATEFVRHLSQRVVLINGLELADLMIEHGIGVRTNRALEFKRLDEDFFAEE
ncbi:MAG: restriction endonuclease [Caulobacteraceae bacterium]